MTTPIISVKNASLVVPEVVEKNLQNRPTSSSILRNSYFKRLSRGEKIVLENINFTLCNGQRLAVLGQNGAGKTSLLRLISGNILPSSGEICVEGETRSLFNLQMGISPNGTGMENIFLRGLQLGMSIKEIRSKIDNAIQFSGIEDSINRKFSTYSAGMKLRLAVAITLMPDPDVLIMDEWVGAGDKTFTNELSKRLNEYVSESRALMIASHNLNLVKRICTHGILLHKGRQIYFGEINEVIRKKQEFDLNIQQGNHV